MGPCVLAVVKVVKNRFKISLWPIFKPHFLEKGGFVLGIIRGYPYPQIAVWRLPKLLHVHPMDGISQASWIASQ